MDEGRHGVRRCGVVALIAAVGVGAAGGCRSVEGEPRNLDLAKREVRRYVESGAYARGLAEVAARATGWLERRAARRAPGERLVVVFDLDETLLSNADYFRNYDFGYTEASWTAWVAEGAAPAIEPVRDVYRAARRLGFEVVFLTARAERQRAGTMKNLGAIGCDAATTIFMPDGERATAAEFKTRERQKLVAGGRTIVANLGDQESDLRGGSAERTFKLPDPFYLTE